MKKKNRTFTLYKALRRRYGSPRGQWGLWCKRKKTPAEQEEVVIGALLTQRTSWKNVERAMTELRRQRMLRLSHIVTLTPQERRIFLRCIRPAGFAKEKMHRLCILARFFQKQKGVHGVRQTTLVTLRHDLLALHGIGPETADSILLYAFHRPVFVIDEYTRRWVKKHRLTSLTSYESLRCFFEERLLRDVRVYQDFHALIVMDGQNT